MSKRTPQEKARQFVELYGASKRTAAKLYEVKDDRTGIMFFNMIPKGKMKPDDEDERIEISVEDLLFPDNNDPEANQPRVLEMLKDDNLKTCVCTLNEILKESKPATDGRCGRCGGK